MLKHILLFCFFISIISSCKCNKGNETTSTTTTTTSTSEQPGTGNDTNATAKADTMTAGAAGVTKPGSAESEQSKAKSLFKKGQERHNTSTTKGYFPEGSERLLTDKDLEYLSAWGYAVMKNEIYARHGMIFPASELKDHFETQSWYHPSSNNVRSMLSKTEKSNLYFMENYKDRPKPENGD